MPLKIALPSALVPLAMLLAAPVAATADLDALLTVVEAKRVEHSIPGVGLTLIAGDRIIWTGGFGVTDLQNPRPVTADTMFRIGSITKTFTALGLLILEEQGALQLNRTVGTYAPHAPYGNAWETTHPITVAQLLEHTAGLQDLSKDEFDHSDPTPLTLEQAFTVRPGSRVVRWKPGLHAVYSNAGYGLAGLVLETAAGVRYEDFIAHGLFRPLGMEQAGFFLDDATRQALATGYDADARTPIRYWHMLYRPFAGINASPRDMAALVRMLINRGRHGNATIVSQASIARMEHPQTSLAARDGLSFGYGLGIYQSYRDGVLFYGHGGDGDGYLAHFAYNRDTGLGYFVVINAFHRRALRAMRADIEHYIASKTVPLTPATVAAVDGSLRAYTGRFELAAWRFPWTTQAQRHAAAMRVTLEDGVLYTQIGNQARHALFPVNERHFRREDEPGATCAFVRDEDGTLYFEEDDSYRRVGE